MKKTLISIAAVLGAQMFALAGCPTISQADRERAAFLVSQMTLKEKCTLIAGTGDGFHTAAIERLGIPSVRMADGPQGVRNKTNSTYYPCGISLAASFNREVAAGVGTGIGDDARARGVGFMLCPGVNIYRNARCGRNFEYYGEDPYLASETALNYIGGIQSKGVMATIKHFAANNQEYDRHWTGSLVDERTLNEIYFPTFRKAVEKGDVAAVMTSYNPVNGTHAAENAWLIGQLRAWGHEGIVMSDWTSTYTTLGSLTSGLDFEMPFPRALTYENILPFVESGAVPESVVDEKCIRILQDFSAYGFLDGPVKDESIPEDYEPSHERAYKAAIEGPVLLKNDGVLPLKGGKYILCGPNADYIPFGGGSGAMQPFAHRTTTLWQGMQKLGRKYSTTLRTIAPSAAEAAKADAIIVAVGFNKISEKEGSDRTYALPAGQDEMIADAVATGRPVVVVVYSGGEIDITKWEDKVSAILFAWYAGQESGRAVADLLGGKASPSGRLPFTFWGSLKANPTDYSYDKEIPEIINGTGKKGRDPYPHAEYREGVFVGYRAIEKFGTQPKYPFGYGLTYSQFEYSGLETEVEDGAVKVRFTVKNIGKAEAAEAAQVYVAPVSPKIARPARELKGYEKKSLKAGESAVYEVLLDESAFKYYDVASHSWVLDNPEFKIEVGASATDIKLSSKINL